LGEALAGRFDDRCEDDPEERQQEPEHEEAHEAEAAARSDRTSYQPTDHASN
jgi:hypothetical protein